MPSTNHSKIAMVGTKRKSDSGKESYVKGNKKPKVDDVAVRSKAHKISKPNPKFSKVEAVHDSSDDDMNDDNSDGGVPLTYSKDTESEGTPTPKENDGVHPDRVKATANGAGPNGIFLYSNIVKRH
jgi:pumilio family protein 6